jgi:hypothetical protein
VIPLETRQHVSPTRNRFTYAKTKKRQRYFGKDVLRRKQGGLGQENPEDLRKHVPSQ